MDSTDKVKSSCDINFEQSFNNSLSLNDFDLNVSPTELVDESELILMSCLRCYIYMMVCGSSPKCPKCFKRGLVYMI